VRRTGRVVALWLALVSGFALLLVISFTLPSAPIRGHMGTSLGQLQLEGHPYVPFFGLMSLAPDNFTDALMLNQALDVSGEPPLQAAFGNYMVVVADGAGEPRPIESLEKAYSGRGSIISYARYWHGYQVILRPLLLVFDYRAIRLANAAVLCACVLLALAAAYLRIGLKAALALAVSLLWVGIAVVPLSMQFMGVFTVTLVGAAVVLAMTDSEGNVPRGVETFLIIGAFTSYLDLFTAPLLTLGIPLSLVLAARIQSRPRSSFLEEMKLAAGLSAAWLAGYAATWAAKWALSSVVMGENLVAEAVEMIAYRLDGPEAGVVFGRAAALVSNAAMMFPLFGYGQAVGMQWSVVVAFLVLPAVAAVAVLVALARHPRKDAKIRSLAALAVVGLTPYVWFLTVSNHSAVHYWFTYRIQAIAVFAAVFSVLFAFDPGWLSALRVRAAGCVERAYVRNR